MPVPKSEQGKGQLSRRDFGKLVAAGGGGLLGLFIGTKVPGVLAQGDPTPSQTRLGEGMQGSENQFDTSSYQKFFADIMAQAEQLGGVWSHPEARLLPRPGFAPYLPATQEEVLARAERVEAETGNTGIGWGQAVLPRAIVLPSDHADDHVRDTYEAVRALGEKRNWGDITAWDGAWVYSMILMGGLKDLQANNQVRVMSNGQMVEIDPVRLDNDAIAVNVVDRGNPKMAVYVVPQNGEIHARLPQDTTESEITMGFALNKHHADVKLDASDDDVPAIIVRGVATAPVTILYSRPTDEKGNYETKVVETRLEPLTGNVTVHLPREDYKGDYAPFIAIRMPVVAGHPQGETEVIFVPGSDVLEGNPKWAPKHRITEQMLKAGRPL